MPGRRALPRRRGMVRSVLPVLGELLVTGGAFLLLYLVWLFCWTSWTSGHQAARAVDAFLADTSPANSQIVDLRTDDPPVPDAPSDGDTFGVLRVPRWGGLTSNTMPITEGTGKNILDRGAAGHYPQTQLPGEVGNTALAGHRRTYGNSFRYVDRLRTGDALVIETADTWYVYEVTGWEIVDPGESDVVAPVPRHPEQRPTQRLLTLTTCHSLTSGEYGNDHRWIVYAEFTGWLPRADGTPAALTPPA